MFKSLIKKCVGPDVIRTVKKRKRQLAHFFYSADPTTLDDLRRVLKNDLGLKQGDKLFVTSAFSNLNAADYSAEDVVCLLKEIVGEEGLIMMPYYPPMNSMEWVRSGKIFDMRSTLSGMGILTNVFARTEGVRMSQHPFKAVCVWGKEADRYVFRHFADEDPYGPQTPYGRLLDESNSKSLCLGVVNLPMFHALEDRYQPAETLYYADELFDVPFVTEDGCTVTCRTKVHSPEKSARTMMGGEFVKRFSTPIRKTCRFGYDQIYLLDHTALVDATQKEFALGHTRRR